MSLKNEVWFLNAPDERVEISFRTQTESGYPGLHIIQYSLPVPGFLFFHLKTLYKRINLLFVSGRLRRIATVFDVCIDFGHYLLYEDTNFVSSKLKIYFPVDDFEDLKPSFRGSNFIFSVSQNIIEKFKNKNLPCHFINHGLSRTFEDLARNRVNNLIEWKKTGKLNVGYAGNLFIPFLDIEILKKVILQHPDIVFHFFGSLKYNNNNPEHVEWNRFLHTTGNIKIYGTLNASDLAMAFADLDAFLLCYKPDNKNYHAENSHKIFEYFSTGRVIISTPISIYKKSELFCMSEDNAGFESCFGRVVSEIEKHNSLEYEKRRILFSLDNVYARQIERIEEVINRPDNLS